MTKLNRTLERVQANVTDAEQQIAALSERRTVLQREIAAGFGSDTTALEQELAGIPSRVRTLTLQLGQLNEELDAYLRDEALEEYRRLCVAYGDEVIKYKQHDTAAKELLRQASVEQAAAQKILEVIYLPRHRRDAARTVALERGVSAEALDRIYVSYPGL